MQNRKEILARVYQSEYENLHVEEATAQDEVAYTRERIAELQKSAEYAQGTLETVRRRIKELEELAQEDGVTLKKPEKQEPLPFTAPF